MSNKNGFNVLSLFDGISGARLALERAGVEVKNYYSSEVDKYAIKIAMKNYPDTIQLGDIARWRGWDIEQPDLIVAGFPCQSWSVAGKQKGLSDPRGKLAIVLLDVFNHHKPKWFLFENVKMKKENLDFMDELFGVKHIQINSALVSAQNRQRCYWTNIPGVDQPEDKDILLKDIIESGEVDRDKSYCIDANYHKGGNLKSYFEKRRRQLVFEELRESRQDLKYRKLSCVECERLQAYPDNYTDGVSNTQRYKALGNSFTVDVIAHIFKQMKV